MKVILREDVPKVGRKFEVIDVADGYAANFLFPQALAEVATAAKVAQLAKKKEAQQAAEDARIADIKEKLAHLEDLTLTIVAKADDQGHLFKKLRADDILAGLKDEHDLALPKESVLLEQPIHELGDHAIPVEAAGEKGTLTVQVVAE
jgi:large subunit ribosomal protein L9